MTKILKLIKPAGRCQMQWADVSEAQIAFGYTEKHYYPYHPRNYGGNAKEIRNFSKEIQVITPRNHRGTDLNLSWSEIESLRKIVLDFNGKLYHFDGIRVEQEDEGTCCCSATYYPVMFYIYRTEE